MKKRSIQSGQILLISLLIMAVALTIGLSLATRTINTLRTTSAEDNSKKAFSAAEAGLEQALTSTSGTITGNFGTDSRYVTSINQLAGNQINNDGFLVHAGSFVTKDDTADIWLSQYPDYTTPWTGTLNIYWGASGDNCAKAEASNTMAALEVVLISGTKTAPLIDHFAFDPCQERRESFNKFAAPALGSYTVAGRNFRYFVSIPVTSGLLARLIPIYAGAYIGVGNINLPSQGTVITSTGISGGTERKIVTYKGYPKAPVELYPYLIFAPK